MHGRNYGQFISLAKEGQWLRNKE